MNNFYYKSLVLLLGLFFSSTLYCSILLPFVAYFSIGSFLVWLAIIVVVEALLLFALVKGVSFGKALFMSLVANTASILVGVLIGAILWLIYAVSSFEGVVSALNFIDPFSVPSIYGVSFIIEFLTLKFFFRYSYEQLFIPVLIGNFITITVSGVYLGGMIFSQG